MIGVGGHKLRRVPIIGVALIAAWLISQILYDSQTVNGFTSFNGKSEIVTLTLQPADSQYGWTLSGAYICYIVGEEPPISSIVRQGPQNKQSLCQGPHGDIGRRYFELPDQVSLSVKEPTTLEVAVVDTPYMVGADTFPSGKLPSSVLTITKADPLGGGRCGQDGAGTPVLSTGTERFELWDGAEIHVPFNEKTLMPFSGKVMVGQAVSANSPQQFRSGVVAVYRDISRPPYAAFLSFGTGGPQLISETSLFPGDVVKFQDHETECFTQASGFLKAQDDDGSSFIQVVASAQSKDSKVVISRDKPDPRGSPDQIAIELQFGDAVVSHPFAVWLGLLVSAFVFVKEAAGLWQSGAQRVRDEETPEAGPSNMGWGSTSISSYQISHRQPGAIE